MNTGNKTKSKKTKISDANKELTTEEINSFSGKIVELVEWSSNGSNNRNSDINKSIYNSFIECIEKHTCLKNWKEIRDKSIDIARKIIKNSNNISDYKDFLLAINIFLNNLWEEYCFDESGFIWCFFVKSCGIRRLQFNSCIKKITNENESIKKTLSEKFKEQCCESEKQN